MIRKLQATLAAIAIGAGLLVAAQAHSQEEKQTPPSMEEMMKLYEQLSAPGPEHARFKAAVGTWKTVAKTWTGPGEPSVSTGVSEISVVFDGRYLKEDFRCTLMDKAFQGVNLLAYDKAKKKYVSVWLDNWSTGFIVMEGTHNPDAKTLTMEGEYDDLMTGPTRMRSVHREVSKDESVMEMFRVGPDGQEHKSMEITYTRTPGQK
ncbi:MAG: DUF1579 domain-containing protein [bacterium]|nr:DUF1579 domain-containing protein [bacterium]